MGEFLIMFGFICLIITLITVFMTWIFSLIESDNLIYKIVSVVIIIGINIGLMYLGSYLIN